MMDGPVTAGLGLDITRIIIANIIEDYVDSVITGSASPQSESLDAGTIRDLCLVSRNLRGITVQALCDVLGVDSISTQNPRQILQCVATNYRKGVHQKDVLQLQAPHSSLIDLYMHFSSAVHLVKDVFECVEAKSVTHQCVYHFAKADLYYRKVSPSFRNAVYWRMASLRELVQLLIIVLEPHRKLMNCMDRVTKGDHSLIIDASQVTKLVTEITTALTQFDYYAASRIHTQAYQHIYERVVPNICSACRWLDRDMTISPLPYTELIGMVMAQYSRLIDLWRAAEQSS